VTRAWIKVPYSTKFSLVFPNEATEGKLNEARVQYNNYLPIVKEDLKELEIRQYHDIPTTSTDGMNLWSLSNIYAKFVTLYPPPEGTNHVNALDEEFIYKIDDQTTMIKRDDGILSILITVGGKCFWKPVTCIPYRRNGVLIVVLKHGQIFQFSEVADQWTEAAEKNITDLGYVSVSTGSV